MQCSIRLVNLSKNVSSYAMCKKMHRQAWQFFLLFAKPCLWTVDCRFRYCACLFVGFACSVMISIWEWRMPCVLRNRSTSGFVQRPSLMARYAYLHASIVNAAWIAIAVYISLLDRGGLLFAWTDGDGRVGCLDGVGAAGCRVSVCCRCVWSVGVWACVGSGRAVR